MKNFLSFAVFCFAAIIFGSFFSCTTQVPKADLKTAVDSLSYTQGVLYASQVEQIFGQLGLEESNKADFIKGFQETFNIDPKDKKANAYVVGKMVAYNLATQFVPGLSAHLFGDDSTKTISKKNFLSGYLTAVKNDTLTIIKRDEAQMYSMMAIENIRKETMEKKYGPVKKENQEWLEKNKSAEGVEVLPSGLQYKVITEGKGAKPLATDMVKVAYKGTTINGEVFDSNESAQFPVNGVIRGWTEGLQLMPVGSKYNFYVPYDLAYGEQGSGDKISPFATLIFEVELLEIVKK